MGWIGLVYTYPLYFIGTTYVVGSVIGWIIISLMVLRWYLSGEEANLSLHPIVWCWIIAMFLMLLILIVGHMNWELGLPKTIKSTFGWAKGWALIAVFIIIGACTRLKPELLVRAACVIGIHTLIFSLITIMLSIVRIPGELYISPLQVIGGPGDSVFSVSLYGLNPENGRARWQFFGPWAPAAGLLACMYFVLCSQEKDPKWRNWGMVGCAMMCLLSQSRAGWAIFLGLIPLIFFGEQVKDPRILLTVGILVPLLLILGEPIYYWITDAHQAIKDARPDSTRVRATLERIALQRWESEAYYFGHGVVERGPKLVEFMPIGSHHSWYGLLFVKGLFGLLCLAIPLTITIIYLFCQSLVRHNAHVALCLLSVLSLYSFFENLEILTYLYWPALIWIGMCFNTTKPGESHVEKC